MTSIMAVQDADAMPNYIQCVTDIYASLNQYLKEADTNYTFPGDLYRDLRRYGEISSRELVVVIIVSISMTLMRYGLTKILFLPLARYFQMTPTNQRKLPESVWKCMYYMCSWGFSCYLLIITVKYDYFYKPYKIWDDWKPQMEIPTDIYVLYMMQLSFYTHSMYTVIYMDSWRKDSLVMIFHHLVTIALTIFSYAARYHKIGILVIFLHDICDIFLEFTKVNVYLKNRGGKYYPIHEKLSTAGFLCFATVWFTFRLYLFPLKVIHATAWATVAVGPKPMVPFYVFFNIQLLIILSLNLYWFMFIANFIIKVLTGQLKEVDDVREDDVIEKMENIKKMQNGTNGHSLQMNGKSDSLVKNGVKSRKQERPKTE